MYSKLSIAFLAALAVVAQAHGHKNGTYSMPSQPQGGSSPAPVPAPLSTGTGGSGSSPGQSGDTTLTYTIGSGASATVVTTTIHRTAFETQTAVSTDFIEYLNTMIDVRSRQVMLLARMVLLRPNITPSIAPSLSHHPPPQLAAAELARVALPAMATARTVPADPAKMGPADLAVALERAELMGPRDLARVQPLVQQALAHPESL
jgi:hypothetical protein